MKREILAIICAVSLSLGMTSEAFAAPAHSSTTTQAAPKKATRKSGTKKSTTAKKYVPASYGDCYVGEQLYIRSGDTNWCEITFNPNGTCVLKTEGYSITGTFTGTVSGSKYKINVRFSDGTSCVFTGNKEKLEGSNESFSYVLNAEH